MPVDPATQVMLDALAASGADALGSGTPESARAFASASGKGRLDPALVVKVGAVTNSSIDGPRGPLRIRIFRPENAGAKLPTVVYFHGGGFVIGDLDTHDDHCRLICRDVEAVVVSVEYGLAPENPFPAPVEDSIGATRWALEHIGELGNDPNLLAVAGDSAGANLAAVVANTFAAEGTHLAAQLLVYPKTDWTDADYPSRTENGEGYYLTTAMGDWFTGHYLPHAADRRDPRASVLFADVAPGLAPAVIGVGEYDILRDEVQAYAGRLAEAGVDVAYHRADGLVHGFFGMRLASTAAAEAVDDLLADFRKLLQPA